MASGSGIRVGDAEREAAANSLREHYAAGRLTMEEFQERLDAALTAKTDLDLAKLTEDLPSTNGYAAPWPPNASATGIQPGPGWQGTGWQGPGSQGSGWQGPGHSSGSGQAGPRVRSRPFASASVAVAALILIMIFALSFSFGGLPKIIILVLGVFAVIRRVIRAITGRWR
jgi:hypothetical protein